MSCLYYSQVKPLNHTPGCHAGQQREVRHSPLPL